MASKQYRIMKENPNRATGGGCVCSVGSDSDCEGPYSAWPYAPVGDQLRPHTVICYRCAKHFVEKVESGAEALGGGESGGERVDRDKEVGNYQVTGLGPEVQEFPEQEAPENLPVVVGYSVDGEDPAEVFEFSQDVVPDAGAPLDD